MLVSASDLTAYMGGVSLSTAETNIVNSIILPGVQQELELFINRPVEPVQIRESLLVDEYGYVTLSVTPVWEIINVMNSAGTPVVNTAYVPSPLVPDVSVNRSVDYSGLGQVALPFRHAVSSWGFSGLPFWGIGTPTYFIVEYIGGYKGYTDSAIKLAICRVAAREVERQFDDSASLQGGNVESADQSDDRRKGWMPEELERFRRIRRRVIR